MGSVLRVAVVALAVLAVLLSGCQQAAQKAVEQATGVQTSQKGDTVTVKGKEGETVVISSQVPEEFKSFPVPQGFKLDSSGTMTQGGDKLSVASWKGNSTFQAVQEFYQKAMPGQGWKEEASFATDTGGMLSYSKGDQNGLTITYGKEGDDITITAMLGKSTAKPSGSGTTSGSSASGSAAKPAGSDASSGAKPTAAAGRPEPTPKPEATPTPEAPKTTDASALPAELKDVPVPSAFAIVKDSVMRQAEGGQFKAAEARWFGKTSLKETAAFYAKTMPGKGWNEDSSEGGEDSASFLYTNLYTNAKDSDLTLEIEVEKVEAGTEIWMRLSK